MGLERLVKIADGLYARYYPSGRRALQVQFFYRGARNRETLKGLDPENRTHIRMARHRVGAIQDAIRRDTFDYREFFPESPRARFFGLPRSRTVKEIGTSWLADMKLSKPHSTYRSYEGPMERFVFPAIGAMKAVDVTPEHIRDLFRNADITLKTARNYSIPLVGLFRRAMGDGDIRSNPMDRVVVKELIPLRKHTSEYEPDPLSEKEIAAFLAACRKHRPKWVNYFTFAFYTGLRTSELYGLQWSDWRDDRLDVVRAVVERQAKGPKTRSSQRTIYVCPAAAVAIEAQRTQTAFREHVFWNPNTQGPLVDYEVSQRAFDYVGKKAGLRRRNQYQTRHTYASNLFLAGENPLFIARQLGHKDLQMLLRTYAKWIQDEDPTATYTPRGSYGQKNAL
jgi:integrase